MVLLQPCFWKFSHKETLEQTLFYWTWILFTKATNYLFELPFGGVRGNVRTLSIACWKACGRLFICNNWTFFASFHISDVTSRYWSKSEFLKGGGWVTLSANFTWKWTSLINLCWYQKLEWLLFHVVSEYRQDVLSFCHKARVWKTDRRTDRHIPKTALAWLLRAGKGDVFLKHSV